MRWLPKAEEAEEEEEAAASHGKESLLRTMKDSIAAHAGVHTAERRGPSSFFRHGVDTEFNLQEHKGANSERWKQKPSCSRRGKEKVKGQSRVDVKMRCADHPMSRVSQVQLRIAMLLAAGESLDRDLHSAMICECAARGDLVTAELWMAKLLQEHFTPDAESGAAIVNACLRDKNAGVVRARQWLVRLLKSSFTPDKDLYARCTPEAGVSARLFASADQRIARLLKGAPDQADLGQLVRESAEVGCAAEAEEWMQVLMDMGKQPDIEAFLSVIKAWGRLGSPTNAEGWMLRMLENGFIPDQAACDGIIDACCSSFLSNRCGREDEAWEGASAGIGALERLTIRMLDKGLWPSQGSLQTEVELFSQAGAHGPLQRVLDKVIDCGAARSWGPRATSMWEFVMQACMEKQDYADVERWFLRLEEEGPAPTARCYNLVVWAWTQAGDCIRAEQSLAKLSEAGFHPEPEILAGLEQLWAQHDLGATADFWRAVFRAHDEQEVDDAASDGNYSALELSSCTALSSSSVSSTRLPSSAEEALPREASSSCSASRLQRRQEGSWTGSTSGNLCVEERCEDECKRIFLNLSIALPPPQSKQPRVGRELVTQSSPLPMAPQPPWQSIRCSGHGHSSDCMDDSSSEASRGTWHRHPPQACMRDLADHTFGTVPAHLEALHELVLEASGHAGRQECTDATEWLSQNAHDVRSLSCEVVRSAKAGAEAECWRWLQRLLHAGLAPDVYACNAALKLWMKTGRAGMADRWLKAMSHAGITRDVVTYNTLICHWAKAGLPGEAEKWLRKMVASGIRPDDKTLAAMVNAYAKLREVAMAERYVAEIKQRGLKLNIACYRSLVDAYTSINDTEKTAYWREELHRAGFEPWSAR